MNEIKKNTQEPENPVVYVVDDDTDLTASIEEFTDSVGLMCSGYASAQQFLDDFDESRVSCLLLDIRMAGLTGLGLQEELNNRGAAMPVIMMSGYSEVEVVTQAMKAGAFDFIKKPFLDINLLELINQAHAKDAQQRATWKRRKIIEAMLSRLSEREREVLELLAAAKNTKTIARELGISIKTVDNHRTKVVYKMQVQNTIELALLMSEYHGHRPIVPLQDLKLQPF
jgi:RNA polymerase sigma factor (sigma-70 family)